MTTSQHRSSPPPSIGARRRRWFGWIATIIVCSAVGYAAYQYGPSIIGSDDNNAEANGARPAPTVVAAIVTEQRFADTIRGIGTLRSPLVVDIAPEVEGVLRAIHVQEGAVVESGQLLFSFDDRRQQRRLESRHAALRVAEARAENAQITFDRVQHLRSQNVATADEYDRARADLNAVLAEVEQLRAEVALAEVELADRTLSSSIQGVIAERLVDPGNYVQVGQRLATIYQLDPLELSFRLPERYIGRLRTGQDVEIRVAAFPDERFDGAITFVGPAVTESTRDILIKAEVSNDDGRLLPGSFATARVTVEERAQRPCVPEEALVSTRHGYSVFVIGEDDTVNLVPVQIGLRSNGLIELREGPSVGSRVVRQGQVRINSGQKVAITNDPATVAEDAPADADHDQAQSADRAASEARGDA